MTPLETDGFRKHLRPNQRLLFLLFICLLGQGARLTAQEEAQHRHGAGEEAPARKTIRAVAIESHITIDGELNEPEWRKAAPSKDFYQRDPEEGQPATEPTTISILYDKQNIYIGVVCYDSDPTKILATERQRDTDLRNDDTIAILLDTFHDLRNGYLFRTNPLGTQQDAYITDEGRDVNRGWNETWYVASKVVRHGWVAEFAIPFKSLRVAGNGAQQWGLEAERVIRRKNEFTYWNSYQRGYKFESVSQAGLLAGLEGFNEGYRLRAKPYFVGGFSHHSDGSRSRFGNASDLGMEVMKYRVTSSLTTDFAANSNFIDSEVDRQQVNLDRWELFYPERREFFLEGGGIFKFGVAQGEMPAPDVSLFHSRRIGVYTKRAGVASRNLTVPMDAGVRVTGKLKGLTLGILNVETGELPSEGVRNSNYGVVRVKRDILARSAVGAFFLNREISGSGDFNRVAGFDTNFVFARHFFANALFAQSLQPGINKDRWVSSGGAKWDSDFVFAGIEYLVVEPNFRDDLGFVPRPNQRRISPVFDIKPRPHSRLIRKLQFGYRLDYVTNQDWVVQTSYNHYNFQIFFQSGDHLMIAPHRRMERVNEPFELRQGVTIPTGTYRWNNVRIAYTVNPARRISGNFVYQPMWGFFGGNVLHEIDFAPRIKVNSNLTLDLGYRVNIADFPQKKFKDHIVNSRIQYAFNNQVLTRTIIQYNSTDSIAGVQFLLDYIFRPGNDFFVIYNDGRTLENFGPKDRTLAVKLTYSFDF
ncbi:MAG: carbohydrate binding family 9 domain-containing protein [Acidobacteria bacterium]|nr:carbohydrate binding family 9 domain-containing protein [Acidobacteriota bacterium]